ncbi:DNA repair ATPase [Pontibacter akesuensis]|uniref:ATPase family associated with various cellular activities (AAA) n=1 Tax=Pontibacter akesuensis TaxID=388950 RepID=A0A1I7K658_9BACT|nr:DNA repair ATPase [Pontibacter akesuensis]GHA74760.1 ATPase AAA [Pontibacter akesuensis]SFU92913.1 ATPase family associated with various cellular activities (AAA) [Pontibacter akesuensis]
MEDNTTVPTQPVAEEIVQLEGGTYEILRNRLQKSGSELRTQLDQLNQERKKVFGAIETKLLATDRITTENNCVAWDMVPVGFNMLFGYNVHIGLKSEVELSDVFGVYTYAGHTFKEQSLELIGDQTFKEDFQKLYKYYKNTQFVKFALIGTHLFMVFRVGKSASDIKTFKWLVQGNELVYLDNRSDHEYVFPNQHDFTWKRTVRESQRKGKYPHVSIEDKVFVETLGGDLTIKVEDNTDSGHGIYSEEVEDKDQSLDDSEIYYAIIGNIILLKIRPYRENNYRYFVFNYKLKEARRIDALEQSCVLLPDNQGIIYPYGYYLQTGEYKEFDNNLRDMLFEKRIVSPNGEDFLYVFYNKEQGTYLLLSYNLINQKIETPIICHGYAIFENGELNYFKADEEPQKHHAVQIWQTPYIGPNYSIPVTQESYLYKIGNKEIVRAMAECTELLSLLQKEDSYTNLYLDLIKLTTNVLDSYHWLSRKETFNLAAPLGGIRQTATAAVDEYEKVLSIRKSTKEQVEGVLGQAEALINTLKLQKAEHINDYVKYLAELRTLRGEVVSLRDLRYADLMKIEAYEAQLLDFAQNMANATVTFLLKPDALQPYEQRVQHLNAAIDTVTKVVEADAIDKEITGVATELEMLIDIVSNLKIEDATQTTSIIDTISGIYSTFNQTKATLKRKRKELLSREGKAEFSSQLKLISQSVISYLDVCDTPQKCEDYLAKLMVQLEELEGKFPDFDEFIEQLAVKREEIYSAFESKKVALQEAQNKRATNLQQAADRILKAVQSRISKLGSIAEINGYFASDLMIEKVRNTVEELLNIGDTVKADTIQSRLKTVKEDAIRQLKDKQELFVAGENVLKFGTHHFTVNTQPFELSVVHRDGAMFFHLTGTNFFEKIVDDAFLSYRQVWEQTLVSENNNVYRAEYLAFQVLQTAQDKSLTSMAGEGFKYLTVDELYKLTEAELREYVARFMAARFNEGYTKGVHDHDAALILGAMVRLTKTADLLRYTSEARACAQLYWDVFASEKRKATLHHQLKGIGAILQVFPDTHQFDNVVEELQQEISAFQQETALFATALAAEAGEYLFYELTRGDHFVIDKFAATLYDGFKHYLTDKKALTAFEASVKALEHNPVEQFELIQHWLKAYALQANQQDKLTYTSEAAVLLLRNGYNGQHVINTVLQETLAQLHGVHHVVQEQQYQLQYHTFLGKLRNYTATTATQFTQFTALKKQLTATFEEQLRLQEFKPRVLSSFVRNKLIDQVYLPLIGANLAKQMGTAGEAKRTDLMGMLLLLSPPGYGKTTLMEYIANRLGIIFMKINGPAIGHQVTAIDPAEAPNAAAREELNKLNLAFEMGDNVMIYLDDIQHCNPEFLQKFISLCDAQRKIEGVYKGKSRTYDFRGKKVCVVMAGNPYTETGEKFRIPDMLANRADIYNLGDIIGDTEDVFKLSYIENSLTSNAVLAKLAGRSQQDVHTLLKLAQTGNSEGLSYEANHSAAEISEYVQVFQKLLRLQDVILKVNMEYIRSAAQADEYRTEPAFKLQGSYRNMNKLAEKVMPIMNDQELQTLILSHYESESQTLTTGAEANMLKFKELLGLQSEVEAQRWQDIKATFVRNNKLKSFGDGNQVGQVLAQMESITGGLTGIQEVLRGLKEEDK